MPYHGSEQCRNCGGEDCCCCEIWTEEQADLKAQRDYPEDFLDYVDFEEYPDDDGEWNDEDERDGDEHFTDEG